MKKSDIQNISDIPGFEQIGEAAAKFNVTFTLFGSAVRRLLDQVERGKQPDIFSLCAHSSDFDILYSETRATKSELVDFLAQNIPYFQCFRWQLFSVEEYKKYEAAAAYNNYIPANLITLSSDPRLGFVDILNGESDIKQTKYHFIRNRLYSKSSLFIGKRDLECFAALIYLGLLAEADVHYLDSQPGSKAIKEIFDEALKPKNIIHTVNLLQESSYVRSRLRYLLKSIGAKAQELETVNRLTASSGLTTYLFEIDSASRDSNRFNLQFDFSKEINIVPGQTQIISSLVSGDKSRLPHFQTSWAIDEQARQSFIDEMKYLSADISIVDNQRIFLASDVVPVSTGNASCGNLTQIVQQELIYFKLFKDFRTLGVPNEDISAFILLKAEGKSHFLPLPCVAEIMPSSGYLCLRINVGATFNLASQYLGSEPLEMRLFAVHLVSQYKFSS